MNSERLQLLINMLESEITDAQFDMGEWMNDCGTVGCAGGWFAKLHPETGFTSDGGYPVFGEHGDFVALAAGFGLTDDQAHRIFAASAYMKEAEINDDGFVIGITRTMVITRIQEVMNENA